MDKQISQIERDEHNGDLNAKKVTIVSTVTINAVVNTATTGDSTAKIGFATVAQGTTPWITSFSGNVTLTDSKGFIGLATVIANQGTSPWVSSIAGNITLSDSKSFIGLATTVNGQSWPDPKSYIGLVTITGTLGLSGNVTISDSKAYIGLTTTTLGSSIAGIGFATVSVTNLARTITGNITLSDPGTYIGLTTTTIGSVPTVTAGFIPFSYYNQSSLASGFIWHGFATPGSNPTTALFRIQRETINTGEVLFANGAATFINVWSAASLNSITYL